MFPNYLYEIEIQRKTNFEQIWRSSIRHFQYENVQLCFSLHKYTTLKSKLNFASNQPSGVVFTKLFCQAKKLRKNVDEIDPGREILMQYEILKST